MIWEGLSAISDANIARFLSCVAQKSAAVLKIVARSLVICTDSRRKFDLRLLFFKLVKKYYVAQIKSLIVQCCARNSG